MNTSELWSYMQRLQDNSGNMVKSVARELYDVEDPEDVELAWNIIAKQPLPEFDDSMGVGKRTVRKAGVGALNRQYDEIRDVEKRIGNLSEVFNELEPQPGLVGDTETTLHTLEELQNDVETTARKSGGALKSFIEDKLGEYKYPQVYSFAILGDISLGISYKTMLQILSDASRYDRSTLDRAYGIAPDIGHQARRLKEEKQPRTSVQPGDRIKPQLASSRDPPEDQFKWIGHVKYDGARILIHSSTWSGKGTGKVEFGQEIQAFTRRQNEVTANLPELEESDWPRCDFIVDGEAMPYDAETGEPLAAQDVMTRLQREQNIEEQRKEVEVRFKLFDLLYYDGVDYTDETYTTRFGRLQNAFPEDMLVEGSGSVQEAYDQAVANGHEGVIAKNIDAEYHFQRHGSWRKVKPVKEPIDVEVTDVQRGTGEMADTLGAIYVQTQDEVSLGKVGTGLTEADRDELWEIHQNGGLEGRIIEIEKFFELQENQAGGYGLRSPVYGRLRPDGEPDTLEKVKSL